MHFYGREQELQALAQTLALDTLDGAIIYGRRRFGKTTLIRKAAESFGGAFVYYQCLKASDAINVRGLAQAAGDALGDVFLSENATFSEVVEYLFRRGQNEPLLLALDEYPYLSGREEIDTRIQSLIDRFRHSSRMKVILAGSSIGIMETILDESNPLHGRFRCKIQLDAFDYLEASRFYPSASNEDKIAYYSVFGGIPYYLSMIDEKLGFEENLKRLVLGPFAPLESEILSTMREEYGKIENATILMTALSEGKHSHSDIKAAFMAQAPSCDFNYLLEQMIGMRFVSKRYSINDYGQKKPYYGIEDNLLSFYYSLVFPNASRRAILSVDGFYSRFVKDRLFAEFIPARFESICKQFLIHKNKEGLFDPPFIALGPYSYNDAKKKKNGQFDIVAEYEDGLCFFECKYTKEKVGQSVYDEEVKQIQELGLKAKKFGFFSKSGFADFKQSNECLCYSLDDLFR